MPRTAKGKRKVKKVYKTTTRPDILLLQKIEYVDYKDVDVIKRYISSGTGKILPRRITGLTAKNQRKMAKAIKQAREVALLPFVAR